ncbi:MAG: Smr/MutS family protein [Chrysiogenetes bacterium]|nr:Smr/MutS family protein [Chrysiogenetes bacterium]
MTNAAHNSLLNLEWPTLLGRLAELTQTDEGARRAAGLPIDLAPDEIRASLTLVTEAMHLLASGAAPGLSGAAPLDTELGRARRGATLEGEDLWRILQSERIACEAHETITAMAGEVPALATRAQELGISRDFISRLERSVDAEGEILDTASATLSGLRRDVRGRADGIRRRIEGILSDEKYQSFLQDDFWTLRENRYVVPLKMGAQAQIDGIVHDTSNTGHTVFLEPREIIDANNRLKMAESELAEEELRVRQELSDRVRARADEIESGAKFLLEFDVLLAKGRLCIALDAHAPELSESGALELRGLGHPLLLLDQDKVITNDVKVGSDSHLLVVSGPNAGGKTVLLKSLALAALMVKAGLPIAAEEGSRIPVYDRVFADIGDAQSLAAHLSSFTGHLTQITHILAEVSPHSLVILDEVMSGTAPTEGAALARALLEHFAAKAGLVVASTHYDEVKAMAESDERHVGLSMAIDPTTLRPTYHVQEGAAARSLAFEAARQIGLPADVLERARELLSPEKREEFTQLERLEAEARRIESVRKQSETQLAEANRKKRDYEAKLEKLKERGDKAILSEAQALREEISAARAALRQVRRAIRMGSAAEGEDALAGALERAEQLADSAKTEESGGGERVDWSQASIGDPVRLAGTTQAGTLVELPDSRGRARVEVGGNRMVVDAARLEAASAPRKAPEVLTTAGVVYETPQGSARTLDLRGEREEEALESLTRFLDQAVLSNLNEVIVIHGHGEGILKRAVREQLKRSPYVSDFRPGGRGEGGDGVSVVTLRAS